MKIPAMRIIIGDTTVTERGIFNRRHALPTISPCVHAAA
jgi:hypothetical protein